MVNGDSDDMTVKLMDIRKPFEKKESGFFKRTPEREDRRRLGKKNTTVFFFFFFAFICLLGLPVIGFPQNLN